MARSVKWLIPAFTVVVVLTTAVIHSQYVALIPYPLTQEPRFKWVLIFIGLLWLTSYAAGLPDRSRHTSPAHRPHPCSARGR